MMLDYIDRHSDDPDLGAATLAAKFRCSQRYVHRLFSTTDRSVGEHVNDRRILACTRKFLDHDCRSKTIAHFNRLFKRSNGTAPREFRRAMTPKTL
jgi:AraC-like DNA-binding protein